MQLVFASSNWILRKLPTHPRQPRNPLPKAAHVSRIW